MSRPLEHEGRHSFAKNERKVITMIRLTKYEKDTIILTNEGDDTYSIYTFNARLKRRLADFAKKCLAVCHGEQGQDTRIPELCDRQGEAIHQADSSV